MASKSFLTTAITTKNKVKSSLQQLENNFKGVDVRSMRFSEKHRDSKAAPHQSLSCQPKRGIEVFTCEEQPNQLRFSASLDPAASRKSLGNESIFQKKLPQSCQNKASSSQSIKGCFLSTKNSGSSVNSTNKGNFFVLSSEGISLKEQGKQSKNITHNTKTFSGSFQGTKKIIRSDRDTITRGNEVFPIKNDRQVSGIQGITPKQVTTTENNKVKKSTKVLQNKNTIIEETSVKTNKVDEQRISNSEQKENLKDIENPSMIGNSQQQQNSSATIKVSNYEKPLDNLIESGMESAIENSSQQQTTQMDSAYNGSQSQQQQQQSVPSQLKGLMTPPAASLSMSATAKGKQLLNPQNFLMSSGHLKNECQVMSESVGLKRPSEFSLVESASQWSCAKCCIWSEEQDKRMRELKTKYHLRDALQRQHLNNLLSENKNFQEQILCLQRQVDHTATLRPLEVAYVRRLAQELAIEKKKYLQGMQFQQSFQQSNTTQMYDASQPMFNQQSQEMNMSNQILLLQRRIKDQDEIIRRLSSEINNLQVSKDQLEEGFKNVLLKTQLQELKKNTPILNKDNMAEQSLRDSQTISFEISQQKPSCLLSSEVSNQRAFCLGSSLQDLPGSLPPSIYLSQNLPAKPSGKTKNTVIIDEPEKSKNISMTASPSSSQARKNSTCSVQEGFIFGPPKNASICSMEELLRTQCQDNERVIFLGETEENIDSQIGQGNKIEQYEILPGQITQQHEDQVNGEVQHQYQEFNEKQKNEGQEQSCIGMISEPHRLKANFTWDAQKQEFVINESQLAVLIANYQKTIAQKKNNNINTLAQA